MLAPMRPNGTVTHDRGEETMEAKARWFQSLTLGDRMDMLCAFTDLALSVNPTLQERKHAQPVAGRIQVLSRENLAQPTHNRSGEMSTDPGKVG
jgi:hypothetical protein